VAQTLVLAVAVLLVGMVSALLMRGGGTHHLPAAGADQASEGAVAA